MCELGRQLEHVSQVVSGIHCSISVDMLRQAVLESVISQELVVFWVSVCQKLQFVFTSLIDEIGSLVWSKFLFTKIAING